MGGCIPFHDPDNLDTNDDDLNGVGKRRTNRQLFATKLKHVELYINSHPNNTINTDLKKRRCALLFEVGYG